MIRLKSILVILFFITIFGLSILLLGDHGRLSLGSHVKKLPIPVSGNSRWNRGRQTVLWKEFIGKNSKGTPSTTGLRTSSSLLEEDPKATPPTTGLRTLSVLSEKDPKATPPTTGLRTPSVLSETDPKATPPTTGLRTPSVLSESTPAYQSTANGGQCLKNHFKDVLLVIIFHYAFYDTLPLILTNYEGAFARIAICGPSSSSSYDIIVVEHNSGYYGYECLGKAVRLNPGLEGYFYVNDDMILNWWNFVKFDKNKIWLGAGVTLKKCHRVGDRPLKKDWMWWTYTSGAEHCEKTYEELKRVADEKKGVKMDVKGMLSTALRNGKNEELCFKGWSDIFYVPARFSDRFQYLSEMFFRNKVFLEISVPTMLSLLDLQTNWEHAYGTYLPDLYGFVNFIKGEHPWKVYSVDKTLFIHPVKYHAKTANVNREKYKTIVVPYGRKFLQC